MLYDSASVATRQPQRCHPIATPFRRHAMPACTSPDGRTRYEVQPVCGLAFTGRSTLKTRLGLRRSSSLACAVPSKSQSARSSARSSTARRKTVQASDHAVFHMQHCRPAQQFRMLRCLLKQSAQLKCKTEPITRKMKTNDLAHLYGVCGSRCSRWRSSAASGSLPGRFVVGICMARLCRDVGRDLDHNDCVLHCQMETCKQCQRHNAFHPRGRYAASSNNIMNTLFGSSR